MVTKFKNDEFDKLINKGKVLVFFSAPWCGYCRMLKEELKELEKKEDINIIEVNIEDHKKITAQYRILSIPVLVLYEDGIKIKSMAGYRPLPELLKFVK